MLVFPRQNFSFWPFLWFGLLGRLLNRGGQLEGFLLPEGGRRHKGFSIVLNFSPHVPREVSPSVPLSQTFHAPQDTKLRDLFTNSLSDQFLQDTGPRSTPSQGCWILKHFACNSLHASFRCANTQPFLCNEVGPFQVVSGNCQAILGNFQAILSPSWQ